MSGAVLVVVDAPGGEPDRLSLEAVTLARGLGGTLEAVLFGKGAAASNLGTRITGFGFINDIATS